MPYPRGVPSFEAPETRYARSGDVHVAYQIAGDGAVDLIYVPSGGHHVELVWENPAQARFLSRLASLSRVLMFDKRGTGMSDRVVGVPTLETRMDDIRAVMDSAGSERAVLFGLGEAGPLCILFAATYPERASALVLFNTTPRLVRNHELPWLPSRAALEQRIEEIPGRWGEVAFHTDSMLRSNPSATEDERVGFARVFRLSMSPGAAVAFLRMNLEVDVCAVLPSIRVPTLVVHRRDVSWPPFASAPFMAERIPGAKLVELPGRDFGPPLGDQDALFGELERFLCEIAEGRAAQKEPDRVLATVLFTDLVGQTAKAVELGPRWQELLREHNAAVRRELIRFSGREIDTAGDGFFASGFDGPARAIRCGCAIRDAITKLGLGVRVGVHTGECDIVDDKLSGLAVNIGARVAAQADKGEVLVSRTVRDLVAGSGISFEPRGLRELKGLGEWPLYAVVDT